MSSSTGKAEPGVYTAIIGENATYQIRGPDGEWVDYGMIRSGDHWFDKTPEQILDDIRKVVVVLGAGTMPPSPRPGPSPPPVFIITDGRSPMRLGEHLAMMKTVAPPDPRPSWEQFRNRRPGRQRRRK